MTSGPPARIDRAALERILQRAAELQAGEHDLGEDVTPDDVLALGRDVGIPARYLQQAILEEQSRVDARSPSGILTWMAGPGSVSAQRVVQGDVERVQIALMAYMEEHELLCVQRRQPGRVSWEPLGGFQAAIRRSTAAFGSGKQPFMLAKANVVHATFTSLEAGYVHVSLIADVRQVRAGFVGGGAALGAVGVAGATLLLALGAFPALAIAPLALGTGLGFGVMRMYPSRAERVLLGLERALDHLEQGTPKARHELPARGGKLGSAIGQEIRKALKGLSVIALLVSCSPGTTRPTFEPMPEARTALVQLEVGPATERLAAALTAQGIPVARVVQRDGYVETAWFDPATGAPAGGRRLGDDRVRVRGWVRPAGRYTSEVTVEAVYRPYADPSASERELEQSVPYAHPVRAKIRSAFAALNASGGDEPDAIAIAERRAERSRPPEMAPAAAAKAAVSAEARSKVAADSAKKDTAAPIVARTDTARAPALRTDTARRATITPPTPVPAVPAQRRDTTTPITAPAPDGFSVQVAATTDTSRANQTAARLQALGITPRIVGEGGLLKVRTPIYPSSEAARALLGRVREVFPDAFVTAR